MPQLLVHPQAKNKCLITESYDWDEEEVSSDDNDVTEVKALMALADEERVSASKESARNGEWIKISMKKVQTLLEMEDNDDRKSFLDYLCIDLNYVEEQRNNLMSKHRNLVQELNTCKEQLLVLKQAKLDLLTMQHVNTEILKENQNLRNELKELTSITEAWLNSSNKVNQCINKQIPTQKKKILGIDQLTEDTSGAGPKDQVFVKSSADNSEISIIGSNIPKLFEDEDSTLSNHDNGKHPLPSLEKLTGDEPIYGPKTIKSILKLKSTFKAETLKGITINEPSSAPARGNKSSSVSKTNSAPAGKIISLRRGIKPRNPQHVIKNYETCGSNVHTTSDHNDIEWFRKREALQAKKVESFKASKTESSSALRSKTPTKSAPSTKIKQSERGISINKERYINELLRMYDKIGSSVNTPTMPPNMLGPDLNSKAVSFNLEDILLYTNNEVALLYPEHNNKDYFKCVSDFISKCCLRKPFTRSLNMYKVFFSIPTGGIYGEVGVNTFRNAIGAHYLPHSSEYVTPPSIDVVRQWFPTIGYGEEVSYKGTLRKSLLPPRWRLLMAQIIQCLGGKTRGFERITYKDAIILYSLANDININYANIFWEDIIIKLKKKQREKVVLYTRFLSLLIMDKMKEEYRDDEVTLYPYSNKPVVFKAPKPSSNAERVPQGRKPRAKPGHKKHLTSSKQPSVFSKEATKDRSSKPLTGSKTGHSKKIKESSSAIDSNPSQPPVFTPVDTRMHKEDQQATGGPISLGVTSEARANPQLSSNKTKSVSDGLENIITTPETGTSNVAKTSEEIKFGAIKLEDLAKLVPNVKVDSKDLDSPEDDPIIVSLTAEFSKILSAHDFSNSLPTELNDLLSKFNELTKEVKGLKQEVHELELELLGDLKDIPSKLEEFTKTVTSLTSQVAELKTLQWELPAEFLSLPVQVASVQAKLKTVDALLAGDQGVPLAGQADTMPAEGENNTNQATISQLFQRRAKKNAERKNLIKTQPETTPPHIPPIITTTTHMQSSFLSNPPESSFQPKKDQTKINKGKKAMFKFVTEDGEHVHLTKEQISAQKKIEEEAKAEAARRKGEIKKEELIDLLGPEVVNKKGPITLKVYKEDDTSEIITEFKASDLHQGEWREVVTSCPNKKGKGWTSIYKQIQERMDYLRTTEAELRIDLDRPLNEQDPLDILNDLANKKRKHADDIHDFFRANKRLKSSVQYKDHPAGIVLNEPVLNFTNVQGLILLAKIDKRNLNPLKQMRVIEQLR
ncbi:hypothetical protein Tco_0583742 [Tanacetum coccineum]